MEAPIHILLVEDDADLNWLLYQALSRAGYTVATAANGRAALEQTRSNSFAVAVIDGKLPDQDGLKLAAAIRRRSPTTAAVLVSGRFDADEEEIQAAIAEGLLAGVVTKPFQFHDLWQAIQLAVTQGKADCSIDGPHPGR